MTVIAMTQEMASLGKDVALGVCEELGLQQVRHEVGDVVAGRMSVKKSLIRRIREGKAGKVERWAADEKTISIFTAEEVYDLAVKGVWPSTPSIASLTIPAGQSDVFNVSVEIPIDAVPGDSDVATVTATSQGDPNVSATTELTTTAQLPDVIFADGFENPS